MSGTITSSPIPISSDFNAKKILIVPLVVQIAYLTFNKFLIFFSKSNVKLPSFGQFILRAELIFLISSFPITGLQKLIFFFIIFEIIKVFINIKYIALSRIERNKV